MGHFKRNIEGNFLVMWDLEVLYDYTLKLISILWNGTLRYCSEFKDCPFMLCSISIGDICRYLQRVTDKKNNSLVKYFYLINDLIDNGHIKLMVSLAI